MPSSLNGTGVTFNDATTLQSGNIPAANLGSGTADSTTFLRGDRTWQTISTSPTTAQVLAATAGASVGAVGTYAFLSQPGETAATIVAGSTYAGSGLSYFGMQALPASSLVESASGRGSSPAGTWRAMGHAGNTGDNRQRATLFLRIS